MFQGVVHANARKIIASYTAHLPENVHVVGSGNFSIETTLRANGYQGVISGCDVSLYSCVLGCYLAGRELQISLNTDEFPELDGLQSFLSDQEGRVLAVSVALDALQFHKRDTAYKRRMYHAYVRNLVALCEKTRRKLQKKRDIVQLNDFSCQDGWQRVAEIPPGPDHAILTFPPTYPGGYERLYDRLHRAFIWSQPSYRELAIGGEFAERVIARPGPWLIGAENSSRSLERITGPPIAQAPRGSSVNISLYSNITTVAKHLIRRRVNILDPRWLRLSDRDNVTDSSELAIHQISRTQANYVRQVYASVDVLQADAAFSYAVTLDGKLLGLLMFAPEVRPHPRRDDFDPRDAIYLLCDLAVSSERYHRLGKLVLMAAMSCEMQQELEYRLVRRVAWCVTTAFSRYPESMKYRGVFKRFSRVQLPDGGYKLNYYSRMGQHTLQEATVEWTNRYRKK